MDNRLSIADNCIQIFLKDGIALSLEKMLEVRGQIAEALEKKQFKLVIKEGKPAGFFTWQVSGDEVFINNMFILRQYRGKDNFFAFRRFFREKYPDTKLFYWQNRKKNKGFLIRRDKELCNI